MNAGGVPNTCKSSGKAPADYLIELGREITFVISYLNEEGMMAIVPGKFSSTWNNP
jgi:hypothetical protein